MSTTRSRLRCPLALSAATLAAAVVLHAHGMRTARRGPSQIAPGTVPDGLLAGDLDDDTAAARPRLVDTGHALDPAASPAPLYTLAPRPAPALERRAPAWRLQAAPARGPPPG